MNNQLQFPWVQPCQVITPIPTSWFMAFLQKVKQQVTCLVNNLDNFGNSLSSRTAYFGNYTHKSICREILR